VPLRITLSCIHASAKQSHKDQQPEEYDRSDINKSSVPRWRCSLPSEDLDRNWIPLIHL